MASVDSKKILCPECRGELLETERTERCGRKTVDVRIARCVSCRKEFGPYTPEYYEFFYDRHMEQSKDSFLDTGKKGIFNEIYFEITGRISFAREKTCNASHWDVWYATADDQDIWIIESSDGFFYMVDYTPDNFEFNREEDHFILNNEKILKSRYCLDARVLFTSGKLPYTPSVGEAVALYKVKRGSIYFLITQYGGNVTVRVGERIPRISLVEAFRSEDLGNRITEARAKWMRHYVKSLVYLFMVFVSLVFVIRGFVAGTEIPVTNKVKVITWNEKAGQDGGYAYLNRFLYGPFTVRNESLHRLWVSLDRPSGTEGNIWLNYRIKLIKEASVGEAKPARLRRFIESLDTAREPVESYGYKGSLLDCKSANRRGPVNSRFLRDRKTFYISEAGSYYIYGQFCGNETLKPEDIRLTLSSGVRASRFYVASLLVFMVLAGLHREQSKEFRYISLRKEEV